MRCVIREAGPDDTVEVHRWIRKLAQYERMEDRCVSSPEDIKAAMSGTPGIKALFISCADNPDGADDPDAGASVAAGFALWYYGFSSFAGKPVLYLEDIFVDPSFRGRGLGREIFRFLCTRCLEENCVRIQWSVLDWNETAIRFYRSLGAADSGGWSLMSLDPRLMV